MPQHCNAAIGSAGLQQIAAVNVKFWQKLRWPAGRNLVVSAAQKPANFKRRRFPPKKMAGG